MAKDVRHMPVTLDRGEAERLVHAYSDLILRLSYTYLKSTDDARISARRSFSSCSKSPRPFPLRSMRRLDHPHGGQPVQGPSEKRLAARYRSPGRGGGRTRPAEEEGSLLSAVNLLPPKYRTVI